MTVDTRIKAALLLGLALIAFVGSDRWFSILDDESEFVAIANQPLSATIDDYLYGNGHPEHPPLADILLHWWLPIGGAARWSLRLPSVLFFLAGLLGFAQVARRVAGDAAFVLLLLLGVLWPFGFHFGRLAGWYSLCFLLVAVLTLAYLRYLERPSRLRLGVFLIAAVLLVYTSYYGWAIVGCLVIDLALIRRHRESLKFLGITIGTLALAYLPLWRVFADQVLYTSSAEILGNTAIFSRSLNALYNFYALYVSESVAPWFWYASIPVSAGIAASIALMLFLLPQQHRRYFIYFALLFGGMVILNIVNTKRMLFISGWLLVSFALALANTERPMQRRLLALVLAFIGAVGWAGVLARDYYAATHFIEPWDVIADDAAIIVNKGGLVVTNSPSFLLSMNYALYRAGLLEASSIPDWDHPAVLNVEGWPEANLAGKTPILFVKGVNANSLNLETIRTAQWLAANCVALNVRQLMPDTGYALKAKFFPNAGQIPFRVTVINYDCSGTPSR